MRLLEIEVEMNATTNDAICDLMAENAALKARAEAAESKLVEAEKQGSHWLARITELERGMLMTNAALAEAQKDTARLDWVQDNGWPDDVSMDQPQTLRDCIDAARGQA